MIDAINFDPERVAIFYHEAEDDILAGGVLADVAITHQVLIRPHVLVDDIEELQEDAYIALDNALRARERELAQRGVSAGETDD